jgi:hypothetical protein
MLISTFCIINKIKIIPIILVLNMVETKILIHVDFGANEDFPLKVLPTETLASIRKILGEQGKPM